MRRIITALIFITAFCLLGCNVVESPASSLKEDVSSAIPKLQEETSVTPSAVEAPVSTSAPITTEIPTKAYSRTAPRNAIEYAQLYSSRLAEASLSWLKDKVEEYDYKGLFYYTSVDGNYISASASGVLMQLNPYDLTIDECTIDFIDMDDDDQRGQRRLYCAYAAISALEFDVLKEDDIKFKYEYGLGDYSDAIEAAIFLFELDNDIWSKAKRSDVLLYSGNYDYYLTYFKTTDNNGKVKELYYVVAKAV